jgi:hypothetical protein
MTVEQALYDISYANIIMYGATLPSYSTKRDSGSLKDANIDASDPRNRQKVIDAINKLNSI